MQWNPATGELHNMVVVDGKVRTRRGLQSIKTPTAGSIYVAGFSVGIPSSTEYWHYLWEQATATSFVTLFVCDEEFNTVLSMPVGPLGARPIITWGMTLRQLMINSPAFSGPFYAMVGGGIMPAVKATSQNPDTTSIDIPPGHICTFGDRTPIAQANTVYFNDAPNTDPRAYVASNAISLPGVVYDMFQGPEGSLYMFTSADTYVLNVDALGQSQSVVGFLQTLSGLSPARTGNAASSNGVVACLSKDGLVTIQGGVQTRVPLLTYPGKRYLSLPCEVNDWRDGRLFPTAHGFLLSFGTKRKHAVNIDVRNGFRSVLWNVGGNAIDVVGMLRSRDGEDLPVLSSRVVQYAGTTDWDGSLVRGVAAGRIEVPTNSSITVREVTVKGDNVGAAVSMAVGAATRASTSPSKTRDTKIGTSLWAATGQLNGREMRTTRLQCNERLTDLEVEIAVDGGDRAVGPVDISVQGQGQERRDRW